MKNFLLGVVAGSALLILGIMLYLRLGLAEVRADLQPSSLETKILTAAVHASIRRQAPEISNPIAPTDENLIAGGKLFSGNCSGCHGNPGSPENNGDSLLRRFSGSQNMAFAGPACLLTENGLPTRIFGPWPLTSGGSVNCLRPFKRRWSPRRPACQIEVLALHLFASTGLRLFLCVSSRELPGLRRCFHVQIPHQPQQGIRMYP